MRSKLIFAGAILLSIAGLIALRSHIAANSVTDTCQVQTTFNASVPSSVESGKSFTVSGISVRPSNSYGVTVTSAVFNMTATNTSPGTYSQNFSRTDPSPTTGASPSYTAYYPNWSLKATGNAGGTIAIKLSSLSAQVQGYGTVNCSPSATLATIKITATSTNSGSGSSSTSSNTSSASNSGSNSASTSGSSAQKSTAHSKKESSKSSSGKSAGPGKSVTVVPLTILVKDNVGNPLKGAIATLDNSEKITSNYRGQAVFSGVELGKHNITVSYNNQTISREINLDSQNTSYTIPINLPVTVRASHKTAIGVGIFLLLIIVIVVLIIRRHGTKSIKSAKANISSPNIQIAPIVNDGKLIQPDAQNHQNNFTPSSENVNPSISGSGSSSPNPPENNPPSNPQPPDQRDPSNS